jgi:uncharacterized membrane protein
MADFERHLTRWQSAGLLDSVVASRIRAYEREQKKSAGQDAKSVGWQVIVALILGAILLACGVALFVSAHWDKIGPLARLALVLAMVSLFDGPARRGHTFDRRGHRACRPNLQHRGALAGGDPDVGRGRALRLDSAARRGAADAHPAALPGVDAV